MKFSHLIVAAAGLTLLSGCAPKEVPTPEPETGRVVEPYEPHEDPEGRELVVPGLASMGASPDSAPESNEAAEEPEKSD